MAFSSRLHSVGYLDGFFGLDLAVQRALIRDRERIDIYQFIGSHFLMKNLE